MNHSAVFSVTERFAMCLEGLIRAVAARISAGVMTGALILLICQRLRRTLGGVQDLILSIRAGKLPQRIALPRAAGVRECRVPSPALGLPRRFGWLISLVPYEAAGFASQLRHLLADPEMAALLAASPRMIRLLRPLCRMLGVELTVPAIPAVLAAGDATVIAGGRGTVEVGEMGPGSPPVPTGYWPESEVEVATAAERLLFFKRDN